MKMKHRWQVRDITLSGKNYTIEYKTENGVQKYAVKVDADGFFETEIAPHDMPLYALARYIDSHAARPATGRRAVWIWFKANALPRISP